MRNSSRDRRVLIGLLLLLLIPTTLILLWSRTPPRPVIPSRAQSGPAGSPQEMLPGIDSSLSEGAARETRGTRASDGPEADADGSFVLRGRVLLPDGQAAAGAQVSLRWHFLAIPPVEWPDRFSGYRRTKPPYLDLPGTVTADGKGEYELPCSIEPEDAPLPLEMLGLSAHLEGFLGTMYFSKSPEPSLRFPDLVLEKGVAVRLRFLDFDDQPVSGVRVRLSVTGDTPRSEGKDERRREIRHLAATSDQDGRAVFRHIPARRGWSFNLFSDHPDHPPVKSHLGRSEVITGEEVDVYLDRGTTIFGIVLDQDGDPLAGASVFPAEVAFGSPKLVRERVAVTDERGWFTLKGVPEGYVRPVVFPVPDPESKAGDGWDELPFVFDVSICEHGSPVNVGALRLAPTGTVSGVLTGSGEKPVPDAEISVIRADFLAYRKITTRKNGTFKLPLPPGPYVLSISSTRRIDPTREGVRMQRFLKKFQIAPDEETSVQIELVPE